MELANNLPETTTEIHKPLCLDSNLVVLRLDQKYFPKLCWKSKTVDANSTGQRCRTPGFPCTKTASHPDHPSRQQPTPSSVTSVADWMGRTPHPSLLLSAALQQPSSRCLKKCRMTFK